MEKKIYAEPEMEIVELENDVILTSGEGYNEYYTPTQNSTAC